MKLLARDLTDDQKEVFTEEFYDLWETAGMDDTDCESPAPYGCPWYWGSKMELEGVDIQEMAKNHFEDYKEEILNAIEAAIEFEEIEIN